MAAPYQCICLPGYTYNEGAKRCLKPCPKDQELDTDDW